MRQNDFKDNVRFKLWLTVLFTQGSKGEMGLPGQPGPMGFGVVGPPVR